MNQKPSDEPKVPAAGVEVAHNMYGLMCEAFGVLISFANEERKWRRRKRFFITLFALIGLTLWLLLYAPMFGLSAAPASRSLGVVPIQGEIGDQYGANARKIVPAIERACASSMTEAIVLRISSPGGSPTDAERIAGAVDACRAGKDGKPGKRVIAVVERVGASAAYLIAVHADEIVATRYSMVGSIGAVMRSVDAQEAAKKIGLHERVYASGKLKAGNSPLSANSPEQDALAQELVDGIAQLFAQEVRDRRGSKLKETPDMFSGRVWLAPEAVELGLIDQAVTFEQLKATRFKDLTVHEFRPTQTFQDKIGLKAMAREFGAGFASELTESSLQ